PTIRETVGVGVVSSAVEAVDVEGEGLRRARGVSDKEEVAKVRRPGPGEIVERLVDHRVGGAKAPERVCAGLGWNASLVEVDVRGACVAEVDDEAAGVGGNIDGELKDSMGGDVVVEGAGVERNGVGVVDGSSVGVATDREGGIEDGAEPEVIGVSRTQWW